MKKFTNIGIVQKIIIALIIIILFNGCMPMASEAATEFKSKKGGSLLEPIFELLTFVADKVMGFLQGNLLTKADMIVPAKTDQAKGVNGTWVVLGVLSVVVLTVATAGIGTAIVGGAAAAAGTWATAAAVASAIVSTTGAVAATATVGIIVCGNQIAKGLSGNFDLPDIRYTPYAIFSGAIPALDINFINPQETVYEVNDKNMVDYIQYIDQWGQRENTLIEGVNSWDEAFNKFREVKEQHGVSTTSEQYFDKGIQESLEDGKYELPVANIWRACTFMFPKTVVDKPGEYGWHSTFYRVNEKVYAVGVYYEKLKDASSGTAEIITYSGDYATAQEKTASAVYVSSAGLLKDTISNGYKTLVQLSMALLLVILVYVGIRMLISSTGADKSKYKKMFFDWCIALILLFVLHVMMLLIITVSQDLTKIFARDTADAVVVPLPADTKIKSDGRYIPLTDLGYETNEKGEPIWVTSYMGYIRLLASGNSFESDSKEGETGYAVGYLVIYLILAIYTVVFTIMYIKRCVYMAFLTLIAPLIAITYPLDKLKDGKAQAFSMWLNEYIFNALLQPIHMLIYLLLISSVLTLAANYPIYSIVAIGFMIPAEKFIRSMFGFTKAKTAGLFNGAAGAGLVMSGVNKIANFGKGKDKNSEEIDYSNRVYYNDAMGGMDAMLSSIGNVPYGIPTPTPVPVPGGTTPVPVPGGTTPVPVPGGTTPVPVPGGTTPVPVPGGTTPVPVPGGTTPVPVPVPGTPIPVPVPGRRRTGQIRYYAPMTVKSRMLRGLKGAGNAVYNKKTIYKPLIKGAVGLIGGAGIGTLGLAAGVATGDFSNAAKFTLAGATAGMGISKSITGQLLNSGSEALEGYKQGYYGEEYQDKVNKKAKQQFIKDGKNRNVFIRNLKREEEKEITSKVDQYYEQNITTAEDMVAAYKLERHFKEKEGKNDAEAFSAAIGTLKISKRMGADPRKNPDAEAKWIKNFTDQNKSTYGTNAEKISKEIMSRVKMYYDIQKEIK